MLSWFRRARLIVPVAAVALVAAGCVDFTGTKVITGEGTPTGDFVVRITCEIGDNVVTQDVTFQGEETVSGDAILLGPLEGEASCFITEIEQAGATSVTYECGDIDIDPIDILELPTDPEGTQSGGPGASAFRGDGEEATCTETPDGLEVEIALEGPAEVDIDYTVINDFAVTPPTTTTPTTTTLPEPAPVEAVAPAPVPAQVVTFTG